VVSAASFRWPEGGSDKPAVVHAVQAVCAALPAGRAGENCPVAGVTGRAADNSGRSAALTVTMLNATAAPSAVSARGLAPPLPLLVTRRRRLTSRRSGLALRRALLVARNFLLTYLQ
jgi:hypothetical protein